VRIVHYGFGMSNTSAGGTVQSVDRAVTVLEILAGNGEAGVTDIATELGVHKSTAFRLIAALERRGLVEQTADRGKYRLGVGILRLAGATSARLDVVQEARPVCRRLAADTGETVNVAVLSDRAALYLDQVAGSSALQPHNWVGQRIPLHATSNGKVLLSGMEPDDLETTLSSLPAYTGATITSRARLRTELAAVRTDGYAVAVDELEEGLTAVASPVRNAHGDVVASLSVSGPSFRLTADRLEALVPAVRGAAAEVSHRLGWGDGMQRSGQR
jgi:DNA-binding IclR family transcriptional regulator